MGKFRKKPVVINAFQFDGSLVSADAIFTAIHELSKTDEKVRIQDLKIIGANDVVSFTVETLEGEMNISKDDYVIVGVQGEIYPCKPDIFEATYEEVE